MPLPQTVQDALDKAGSPSDLRLRTTLRRDDVHVWTSADLTAPRFFTLAKVPDDLLAAINYEDEVVSYSVTDAHAAHDAMVARLERLLAERKGAA